MRSNVGVFSLRVIRGIAVGLAMVAVSMQISAQEPPISGVAVAAGKLVLNDGMNTPFLPRGFISVGILYPAYYVQQKGMPCPGIDSTIVPYLEDAQTAITAENLPGEGYNADIQAMMTDWNINTIRFQISQGALLWGLGQTPPDTTYRDMVRSVIAKARAAGLVVIITLQTESESCTPKESDDEWQKLPKQNTELAWKSLLDTTITGDSGVIIEPFNEPATSVECPSESKGNYNWGLWATGCNPEQDPMEGMVTVAKYIRGTLGANNVLLFDADNVAGGFLPDSGTGLPFNPASYSMPSNSAYTVHPFYYILGPSDWDSRWGNFASKHAVVVGAWDISVNCKPDPNNYASTLVNTYLPSKDVGLLGFAWDAPITEAGYLVNSYDFTLPDGTNYTADYTKQDPNKYQERNGQLDVCYSTGATLLYNKFQTQH